MTTKLTAAREDERRTADELTTALDELRVTKSLARQLQAQTPTAEDSNLVDRLRQEIAALHRQIATMRASGANPSPPSGYHSAQHGVTGADSRSRSPEPRFGPSASSAHPPNSPYRATTSSRARPSDEDDGKLSDAAAAALLKKMEDVRAALKDRMNAGHRHHETQAALHRLSGDLNAQFTATQLDIKGWNANGYAHFATHLLPQKLKTIKGANARPCMAVLLWVDAVRRVIEDSPSDALPHMLALRPLIYMMIPPDDPMPHVDRQLNAAFWLVFNSEEGQKHLVAFEEEANSMPKGLDMRTEAFLPRGECVFIGRRLVITQKGGGDGRCPSVEELDPAAAEWLAYEVSARWRTEEDADKAAVQNRIQHAFEMASSPNMRFLSGPTLEIAESIFEPAFGAYASHVKFIVHLPRHNAKALMKFGGLRSQDAAASWVSFAIHDPEPVNKKQAGRSSYFAEGEDMTDKQRHLAPRVDGSLHDDALEALDKSHYVDTTVLTEVLRPFVDDFPDNFVVVDAAIATLWQRNPSAASASKSLQKDSGKTILFAFHTTQPAHYVAVSWDIAAGKAIVRDSLPTTRKTSLGRVRDFLLHIAHPFHLRIPEVELDHSTPVQDGVDCAYETVNNICFFATGRMGTTKRADTMTLIMPRAKTGTKKTPTFPAHDAKKDATPPTAERQEKSSPAPAKKADKSTAGRPPTDAAQGTRDEPTQDEPRDDAAPAPPRGTWRRSLCITVNCKKATTAGAKNVWSSIAKLMVSSRPAPKIWPKHTPGDEGCETRKLWFFADQDCPEKERTKLEAAIHDATSTSKGASAGAATWQAKEWVPLSASTGVSALIINVRLSHLAAKSKKIQQAIDDFNAVATVKAALGELHKDGHGFNVACTPANDDVHAAMLNADFRDVAQAALGRVTTAIAPPPVSPEAKAARAASTRKTGAKPPPSPPTKPTTKPVPTAAPLPATKKPVAATKSFKDALGAKPAAQGGLSTTAPPKPMTTAPPKPLTAPPPEPPTTSSRGTDVDLDKAPQALKSDATFRIYAPGSHRNADREKWLQAIADKLTVKNLPEWSITSVKTKDEDARTVITAVAVVPPGLDKAGACRAIGAAIGRDDLTVTVHFWRKLLADGISAPTGKQKHDPKAAAAAPTVPFRTMEKGTALPEYPGQKEPTPSDRPLLCVHTPASTTKIRCPLCKDGAVFNGPISTITRLLRRHALSVHKMRLRHYRSKPCPCGDKACDALVLGRGLSADPHSKTKKCDACSILLPPGDAHCCLPLKQQLEPPTKPGKPPTGANEKKPSPTVQDTAKRTHAEPATPPSKTGEKEKKPPTTAQDAAKRPPSPSKPSAKSTATPAPQAATSKPPVAPKAAKRATSAPASGGPEAEKAPVTPAKKAAKNVPAVDAPDPPDFPGVERPTPTLDHLQRRDLLILINASATAIPAAAKGARTYETECSHARNLRKIATAARSPAFLSHIAPTDSAIRFIEEWFTQEKEARRWKWTTTNTVLASICGAMKDAPVYVPTMQRGWPISQTPVFSRALAKASQMARGENPKQASPLTPIQAIKACQLATEEGDHRSAGVIALSWVTCARTGDVRKLRREDVALKDNGLISVTFRRGKTAKLARIPNTLESLTGKFHPFIVRALETAELPSSKGWVFYAKTREARLKFAEPVCRYLRAAGGSKNFDNRSIRHGALQWLAQAGAPVKTLLRFSGHSSEASLRTYLGFGKLLSDAVRDTTSAPGLTSLVNPTESTRSSTSTSSRRDTSSGPAIRPPRTKRKAATSRSTRNRC